MQRVRDPVLDREALSWRYDRLTVHKLPTIHSNKLLETASGRPGLLVSISTPLNHIVSPLMHHLRF